MTSQSWRFCSLCFSGAKIRSSKYEETASIGSDVGECLSLSSTGESWLILTFAFTAHPGGFHIPQGQRTMLRDFRIVTNAQAPRPPCTSVSDGIRQPGITAASHIWRLSLSYE